MAKSSGGKHDGGGSHGKPYQKGNDAKQSRKEGDGQPPKGRTGPSKWNDPKKK